MSTAWRLFFHWPEGGIWSNLLASALCWSLGAAAAARRFNCKVSGCWRLGTQPVPGTTYRTCHRHCTAHDHQELHRHHAASRPEQHQYLNDEDSER